MSRGPDDVMSRVFVTLMTVIASLQGPAVCPCRVVARLGPADRPNSLADQSPPRPRCGCHGPHTTPVTPQSPEPVHCPCDHPAPSALPATPPRVVGFDGGDDSDAGFASPLHAPGLIARMPPAPEEGDSGEPTRQSWWPSARAFLRFTHAFRC